MSATIILDPCATLTTSPGLAARDSAIGLRATPSRPAVTPASWVDLHFMQTGDGLRHALTLAERKTLSRGQITEARRRRIVASAHVRCTTFFVNARRKDEACDLGDRAALSSLGNSR